MMWNVRACGICVAARGRRCWCVVVVGGDGDAVCACDVHRVCVCAVVVVQDKTVMCGDVQRSGGRRLCVSDGDGLIVYVWIPVSV